MMLGRAMKPIKWNNPQKVFCDFTCILHSPLSINEIRGVGKVCKDVTYTLTYTNRLMDFRFFVTSFLKMTRGVNWYIIPFL